MELVIFKKGINKTTIQKTISILKLIYELNILEKLDKKIPPRIKIIKKKILWNKFSITIK
ncbi:MAG: hypothetical protein LBL91_04760 [Lachnospiraceae bacterium]|nr:hypothetical protein [Lachnospiraceae bacterium]